MIVSARNNFDGTSGFELVNREIAFYGFGAVARAVHKLAVGFGMKSFAYDPYIPAEKIKVTSVVSSDGVARLNHWWTHFDHFGCLNDI